MRWWSMSWPRWAGEASGDLSEGGHMWATPIGHSGRGGTTRGGGSRRQWKGRGGGLHGLVEGAWTGEEEGVMTHLPESTNSAVT